MDVRRMFTYDYNSKNDSQEAKLCDVAYWDGSSVKTTSIDNWSDSLGTPIGVVVIPSGILPDGMARIMRYESLNTRWGSQSDTVLKNYTKVPTTNNIDEKISSSSTYGYLPSDSFSGEQSFVDPKSFYNTSATLYLPSPWLGDKFNTGYNCEISNQLNALGDFNGDLNTNTLNDLGIFNSINYSDNVSSLKWYIPALGELGYIMPRAAGIIKVFERFRYYGSFSIFKGNIWSSTEYDSQKAWYLNFDNGHVGARYKTYAHTILLFAKLEVSS